MSSRNWLDRLLEQITKGEKPRSEYGKRELEKVVEKKRKTMRCLTKLRTIKGKCESVVNECDREMTYIKKCFLIVLLCCLLVGGCSGGVAVSAAVGGSIHDPKHPRLPEVIQATPIMSTSTNKEFALPMVGGAK